MSAVLGGYELLQRLAVGGMAEVFLARKAGPAGFEKRLALKRILPHLSDQPDFVHMFLDEAKLAARLDHPNIVHIHDFGRDGDLYWLAMEYVLGEDLEAICKRARSQNAPVSPIDAATLLAHACEGLHHAHEQGVVHRDVTPSNLLVSYDGVVKLADFGIAKAEESIGRTHAGALKGKIAYMSPEQARGEAIDRRTDVYSLGVCGWELVTGRRLRLPERTDLETLADAQRGEVPLPSTVRPVPAALEEILMKALAPVADDRWPTARALGEALRGFIAAQGETSSPARLAAWLERLFGPHAADRTQTLEIPLEPTVPATPVASALRDKVAHAPEALIAHMRELHRHLPRVDLPRLRLILPLVAILLSSLGLILALRSPASVPRERPPVPAEARPEPEIQPDPPPQPRAHHDKVSARKRVRQGMMVPTEGGK
jgi:serine/threonine-protein kinase